MSTVAIFVLLDVYVGVTVLLLTFAVIFSVFPSSIVIDVLFNSKLLLGLPPPIPLNRLEIIPIPVSAPLNVICNNDASILVVEPDELVVGLLLVVELVVFVFIFRSAFLIYPVTFTLTL